MMGAAERRGRTESICDIAGMDEYFGLPRGHGQLYHSAVPRRYMLQLGTNDCVDCLCTKGSL